MNADVLVWDTVDDAGIVFDSPLDGFENWWPWRTSTQPPQDESQAPVDCSACS